MNSPPADQQFPAELLQLQKSELFQWNLSDVGLNVALRFTMVFTVFAATQHTAERETYPGAQRTVIKKLSFGVANTVAINQKFFCDKPKYIHFYKN